MEVMGLMLGEFVDDYTVKVVDVFAMPQVRRPAECRVPSAVATRRGAGAARCIPRSLAAGRAAAATFSASVGRRRVGLGPLVRAGACDEP